MHGAATRRTVLLLVLLLAFALRLSHLGAKSLWQDEIFTAAIASTGNRVLEVVTIPLYNTALPAPPLYFLVTHFFLYIGDNDFLLRFPALLFGVLGVSATYALGARLFGKSEGLVGAFLLCVSSLHVRYSQDARFYSLLAFLSLLSLYFLYRALSDNRRIWWIGFVACTVLNVYNHLFGLLVLLSQIVFMGGLWIGNSLMARRDHSAIAQLTEPPHKADCAHDKRKNLAALVSLAIIVVLYGPMIPHLLRGLTSRKGLGGMATPGISLTPSFLAQVLEAWGSGPGFALLVFLIPFIIGLVACVRTRRTQLWLAFSWLVVPFAVLFLLPAKHGFRPRYVLFMLPLYLIFIARGLTFLSDVVDNWLERRRVRRTGVFLALSSAVLVLVSWPALQGYYTEQRSDWKAVADLLMRSFSPGEVIVSPGPFPQVVLPRYNENLAEATFLIGGSELALSSDGYGHEGVWFIGPGRESMISIESDLRETPDRLFKAVFEVDRDSASRGLRLSIAPTMYSDLWVIYVRQGMDAEEANQRYEEALEVVPASVASSVHTTLGDLYREQRALQEAVAHYRQAIILDPQAAEPHRRLAELYENQGMESEAAAEWETYEQLMDQK